MIKLLVIGLVGVLLTGCSSEEGMQRVITDYEKHCTQDTMTKRAEFILSCIENGNPKSDEEPEDWIGKCKEMAEDTYCPLEKAITTQECSITNEFGGCTWYYARTVNKEYEVVR